MTSLNITPRERIIPLDFLNSRINFIFINENKPYRTEKIFIERKHVDNQDCLDSTEK